MEALLNQWLWRQEYWLPPGVTWEDMKETENVHYPRPSHLFFGIPCALILTGLRFIFERCVALPLSKKMGIREKYKRKPSNKPVLEDFYSKNGKHPTELEILSLSAECNMHFRQVEHWFRYRRNQDRSSTTKKFCEASWRFIIYLISFLTGVSVLIDKPWFWDQREFWTDYPYQPLVSSLYWYYMLQLGFYSSMLMTLAFDVKRKDLKEQTVHHFATIFLITFSYCANYMRAGTLVMLLHDAADHFLELAKICTYSKWKRTCNILFVIFVLVFIVTRLYLLPTRIIYSTYYYSMLRFQPFFGYYFFNALLMILQILHMFWAYMILRMLYRFTFTGKLGNDVRSDVEDSDNSGQGFKKSSEVEKKRGHRRSNNNFVSRKATENGVISNSH
ncbi:ceramide synthase 4-like [Rana temporaria]|uniref:ceramide synthase 4-like n=1 Tax=Rana temporaria TaxID=8407 RepID=UPI001AACFE63|nr:ceramide synthase 4-like [Rana temporaria]